MIIATHSTADLLILILFFYSVLEIAVNNRVSLVDILIQIASQKVGVNHTIELIFEHLNYLF